ncbi:MAG: pyridoxamine 5'-phosphate oxidase family protein [Hyphomicrobiaceae bacterium]|nr:pyridoxamine 5'-phosphate oxidase family protein [Hyphomicrobiaceae bacterium]
MIPDDASFITDEAALRALHHQPMSRATEKVLDRLDKHCRVIIAASPFCLLATQGPAGADVSPRGDPAGFVRAVDDRHVLVPDRVGNNRLDTMVNLFANPEIGLLILVPGMDETLRINGRARVTDDARLLEPCAINGRAPKVGILVEVVEAFLHCPKAFIRSKLWDTSRFIDRAQLPSFTEMLMDHVEGLTEDENARQSKVMAERGLY